MICCCSFLFRSSPCKYILLVIYVLAHSTVVCSAAVRYQPKLVGEYWYLGSRNFMIPTPFIGFYSRGQLCCHCGDAVSVRQICSLWFHRMLDLRFRVISSSFDHGNSGHFLPNHTYSVRLAGSAPILCVYSDWCPNDNWRRNPQKRVRRIGLCIGCHVTIQRHCIPLPVFTRPNWFDRWLKINVFI